MIDAGRPLIDLVEERDLDARLNADESRRSIAAMCLSVERACRAIGFGAGEGYERVATLVARVAGRGVLVRRAQEIGEDKDVQLSVRHVKRAIDELVRYGVLSSTEETAEATQQRGRRPIVYHLRVDWEGVGRTLAQVSAAQDRPMATACQTGGQGASEAMRQCEAAAEKMPAESGARSAEEFRASCGHHLGMMVASCGHDGGMMSASSGHLTDRSSLYPNTQIPGPRPVSRSVDAGSGPDHGCGDRGVRQPVAAGAVTMTVEQVTASAARLYRALRYQGSEGRTLWLVAAALDAGLIAESSIGDAVQGVRLCKPRDVVAYFRTCLAEQCGLDAAGMRALLSQVAIAGAIPAGVPQCGTRASQGHPVANVMVQAPPRDPRRDWDREANDARNRLVAAFGGVR